MSSAILGDFVATMTNFYTYRPNIWNVVNGFESYRSNIWTPLNMPSAIFGGFVDVIIISLTNRSNISTFKPIDILSEMLEMAHLNIPFFIFGDFYGKIIDFFTNRSNISLTFTHMYLKSKCFVLCHIWGSSCNN